ncbi:hypothetical protein ACRS8P_03220 [Burkholderia cenocepacia]
MTIDKIGRACRTAIASADEDNRAPQALCIFRRCGAVADFYRVHYLHASIQGDTLDLKNEKAAADTSAFTLGCAPRPDRVRRLFGLQTTSSSSEKESSEHTDFMTNLKSDDYEKCALIH